MAAVNDEYEVERYDAGDFDRLTADAHDWERHELIDGYISLQARPSTRHQRVAALLTRMLMDFFDGKQCEVLQEVEVRLADDAERCENVYVPDIIVVCDLDKIKQLRVEGTPDMVVEVVSPSTKRADYRDKLRNYIRFGVREYWIVDPAKGVVTVIQNTGGVAGEQSYTFDDVVPSALFDGLRLDFGKARLNDVE